MTTIADIADVNPRLSVSLSDDDFVSFLGMADVSELGQTSPGEERSYADVKKGYTPFHNGDLLVAKITPCFENGKIAQASLSRQVGFGSTEFHVIRVDPEKSDPRYVLHLLRSPAVRSEGEKRMTGSAGQKRVPKDFIAGLEIPLPPLAEQRRIASILDQVDQLRMRHRSSITRLEELERAVFESAPSDDELVELGTVFAVSGGKRLPKGEPYSDFPSPHPYLRVSDISNGTFNTDDLRFLTPEVQRQISRYTVAEDDVVISIAGTIGLVALVSGALDGANLTENAARLRLREGVQASARYMRHELQSPRVQSQIRTATGQVTIGKLALFRIEKLLIKVPAIELQLRVTKNLELIEHALDIQIRALALLDELFASLQYRAFNGEL